LGKKGKGFRRKVVQVEKNWGAFPQGVKVDRGNSSNETETTGRQSLEKRKKVSGPLKYFAATRWIRGWGRGGGRVFPLGLLGGKARIDT